MSKQDPLPSSSAASSSISNSPVYRIGDLVWCQEARNNKLWWPAMVTYDPHLSIFYRTTKTKCVQYHVQYFGISAIRGWVSLKSCVPLVSPEEKAFNEKGLSKKVKSEYEVAIQEVTEAAKLDHKQRKLKFIFSFGPSKGGKKSKPKPSTPASSSHHAVQVKTEHPTDIKRDDCSPQIKQEATPRGGAEPTRNKRRKPGSSTVTDTKTTATIPLEVPSSDSDTPTLRTSNRVKARQTSVSDGKNNTPTTGTPPAATVMADRKSGHDKDTTSRSKPKLLSLPANGQWGSKKPGGGGGSSDTPMSPLCLHSQHYTRPSTRRSSSDSSYQDCDQCMDYISKTEAVGLKCTVEPEVFVDDSHLETEGEPILMYVQKQQEDGPVIQPSSSSKANSLPNLNHHNPPLTKGVSTKNLSTSSSHLSGSLHRASHLKGAGKSCLPNDTPSSPADSLGSNSESAFETGTSVAHLSLAGRKRKKRTNSSCSSMPTSPLVEVQSKHLKAGAGEEGEGGLEGKKRKRGRTHSSSSVANKVQTDAGSKEAGMSTVKRVRRSDIRHSEPLGMKRTRRNSAPLKKSLPYNISPAATPSMSANDSGNESSIASLTTPILTPATSSSEDATTIDTRSDTEASISSKGQSSARDKKKAAKPQIPFDAEPKRICSVCDCEGAELACTGHCMSYFHLDCLGLVEEPSFKFLCDECLISSGTCFACGKGDGQVRKCSRPKCPKLYHQECVQGNKLFQIGKSSSFTCPLHVCARCVSIGVSSIEHSTQLLQCVRCPLALHKPDCLVAGCEVIGPTQMICYKHVKITKNTKLYSHININTCLECGAIGSLYCCDVCSAAYHAECLEPDTRPASDGNHWKCPSCAVHDLPVYGSLVITKFGVWRWWPSEVVHPDDIPDNILAKKPGDCMFVVRFCGSRDFCWTYHGRVLPYSDEMELEARGHHKKPKTTDNYKKACEEAKEIHQNRKKVLEAKEAARQNSKFYTKIKSNKYLVPRPPLDLESPEFLPCQCTPHNPCKDDSTCVNRAIRSECNPKTCPAGDLCQNQRMQKCQNARTELFFTGNRGWGLKAAADLNAGDFVIEYVGEVLDGDMCRGRLKKAHSTNTNNFYMLTLDAGLVIDAGCKSNLARFINHSCSPNCETQKWRARGEPRIGIFARESIKAGTELTFDYQLDSLGNEKKKCFCGSKNCSGFLGLRSSKVNSEEEVKPKPKPKKKKKPKPRQPIKKEAEEEEEDRHDDECFVCKDGGELLLCDRKSCCRAYHLECISRKMIPPKSIKWECPWHFCSKCQKTAVSFCSTCPVSFCAKDLKDNLFNTEDSNILLCRDCREIAMARSMQISTSQSGTSRSDQEEVKLKSPVTPSVSNPATQQQQQQQQQHQQQQQPPAPVEQQQQREKASSKKLFRPMDPDNTKPSSPPKFMLAHRLSPPQAQAAVTAPGVLMSGTSGPTAPGQSPEALVRSPRGHISPTPPSGPTPSVTASSSEVHSKDVAVDPQAVTTLAHVPDAHRSPSAFRTCLTTSRPPLFQPQSPTFGQTYPVAPIPPESHSSAKLPEGFVDLSGTRAMGTPGFQPPQQPPAAAAAMCNSFINPVWFMPRNGLMNGLDPTAGGFGYPSYPSALINPNPLGFPYPTPTGYFGGGDPNIQNLESFNIGMHHQLPSAPPPPSNSSSAGHTPSATVAPPTSSSFPAMFSPAAAQQNAFLATWKYC